MSDSPNQATEQAASFAELFRRTYPSIVAYARRRLAADQVDDVVSEVFATAWRRRADLDPAAEPLPWLYGIAANAVRNQRRSQGRHLRLVERIETEPTPRPDADPAERPGADLRAALERLSFDDQEVLRLVAWEGLAHAQVGQVLGCSTNAVGIRIHRARQRLEVELERLADTATPPPTSPNAPTDTDTRGER